MGIRLSFSFLKNSKNLDPSCKTHLDLCLGRVKFVLQQNFIRLILLFAVILKKGWLVGLNGPLSQYSSLYRAVFQTEWEKAVRNDRREKDVQTTPTSTYRKRNRPLPYYYPNQLLRLCTARTAWSDSVIRSETNLITESDRSGPIR